MLAAWRLHCNTCQENLSHLQFRSQITPYLLKAGPQRVRKLELAGVLAENVRYDGVDRTLGFTSQERYKVWSKNIKNICKKCNVQLHMERRIYV